MNKPGYGAHVVQRLLPDQWRILRRLRLAGLTELIGEDHEYYAQEEALDEFAWQAMIATHPQFVASSHSGPVGLASVLLEPEKDVEVSFLWVDPDHRGAGVAQALTAAVADWASRGGYRAGVTLKRNRRL